MEKNMMIMLIAGIVAGAVIGAGVVVLLDDNNTTSPGDEFDHDGLMIMNANTPGQEILSAVVGEVPNTEFTEGETVTSEGAYFKGWNVTGRGYVEQNVGYYYALEKDDERLMIEVLYFRNMNDAVQKWAEYVVTMEEYGLSPRTDSKCELSAFGYSTFMGQQHEELTMRQWCVQDLNIVINISGDVSFNLMEEVHLLLQDYIHANAEESPLLY